MNSNKDIQNESVILKKKRSTGFKIFKYFSIVTSTFILILIILSIWIYVSLFSGPGIMEMSDFHPFKSEEAKSRYLAFEDNMKKKWTVISEEKIVETSFGKTFMRISGPADAPPLVLLPGGGCNSLIWNANIKALSEEYRTYALDNIYDFGRSVYTRKIENGNDFSEWLNELFDTLRLGNEIRIIGYSYGGWVTSQYALYHPERLTRVVLIAPAFTVLDISNEFIWNMIGTLLPVRYFKQKVMYSVWKDLLNMGEYGKEIVEERINYIEIAYSSFKFKSPPNPTVLTDFELKNIQVPLLFLVGENETVYNADSAINRLNKLAPGIETELISGTGHDLMFTHTDLVNGKILKFLK
ncbi:MAG: alpha/beta hydrolase [Ignavibacteria bacterium]|jgi:pimeloyl-ACP methyl ester carboxylesterase